MVTRFLGIALISVLISSCSQQAIVMGTYERKFETLKLNSDSTYEYMYRIEWPQSASKGTWGKVGENKIELNSFYDLEKLPIKVNEEYDKDLNGVVIKVSLEGNLDTSLFKGIEFSLFLDGVEVIRQTNPVLNVSVEEFNTMKVVVNFVPDNLPLTYAIRENVATEEYQVENFHSNTFNVSIPFDAEMLYSETVKNDIIELKGSNLYWQNKGKPYFKRY